MRSTMEWTRAAKKDYGRLELVHQRTVDECFEEMEHIPFRGDVDLTILSSSSVVCPQSSFTLMLLGGRREGANVPPERGVRHPIEPPFLCPNSVQALSRVFRKLRMQHSLDMLFDLPSRAKWKLPQLSIKPGQLVLLKENSKSSMEWNLARIERTYPGADGVVRVPRHQNPKEFFDEVSRLNSSTPFEEGVGQNIQRGPGYYIRRYKFKKLEFCRLPTEYQFNQGLWVSFLSCVKLLSLQDESSVFEDWGKKRSSRLHTGINNTGSAKTRYSSITMMRLLTVSLPMMDFFKEGMSHV
ncbi:hypothetical protein HNY73_004648 [Argiope bruennichi]|uniref:DUF5641 domain-containing protein n=1 Tax=Argiope bruennichi TaxID=94029 RepID=A0A8T0FS56_ARGBR|nr:hypothetical protein HNY73_004648 [Argiope bruennichi]